MVPEYLAEEYKAIMDENGSAYSIIVRVIPSSSSDSEASIKYCNESKREVKC